VDLLLIFADVRGAFDIACTQRYTEHSSWGLNAIAVGVGGACLLKEQ
jgi:hypothetical protein